MRFYCGKDGLRESITRIGRHYGLCDAAGRSNDSEIVRVLLVIGLTQGSPNHVADAVEVAVAAQRPMMASALGRRIATEYSATGKTGSVSRHAAPGHGRNERKNQAKVVLDDWLADALRSIAPAYMDDMGVIRDSKMVADLCNNAVRHPNLHAIFVGYIQRTSVLRERLGQAEGWIRQVVAEAMNEGQRRVG